MKKQLKLGVLLLALTTVLAMALTGCGGKKVKVTFMNGEEKVGEIEATAGKTISGYEDFEEYENCTFEGWYGTPTFLESSAYDLKSATFDEDTVIYGNFKDAQAEPDTRTWTICGTGSSDALSLSNWNNKCDDASVTFTLTGNETNEFVLTVNLCAGDQFQIIPDYGWDAQKGFGYITECDASCFENGGGLSGSDATANINVIMDGNYTITMVTNPANPAQDTISIVRNGDIQ